MKIVLAYPFKQRTPTGPEAAADAPGGERRPDPGPVYSEEEQFVHRVNYFLRRQGMLDSCSYSEERGGDDPGWRENEYTLKKMEGLMDADIGPSTQIDFEKLKAASRREPEPNPAPEPQRAAG